MSLGGEAIFDAMTKREQRLLQEAWIWRAIQKLAYRDPFRGVEIRIDPRTESVIVYANRKVYELPQDGDQLLEDGRNA